MGKFNKGGSGGGGGGFKAKQQIAFKQKNKSPGKGNFQKSPEAGRRQSDGGKPRQQQQGGVFQNRNKNTPGKKTTPQKSPQTPKKTIAPLQEKSAEKSIKPKPQQQQKPGLAMKMKKETPQKMTAAGKKMAPKEKLNFDESSDEDEEGDEDDLTDEEMDDEVGSSEDEGIESSEDEGIDVKNKKQLGKQKQNEAAALNKSGSIKSEPKTPPQPTPKKALQEKAIAIAAAKQVTGKKDDQKKPVVQPKKELKEKLAFDESSDDDLDEEELTDEEMDDEMDDEDEMESEEEDEAEAEIPMKNKQLTSGKAEKRKLQQETPPGMKKVRMEEAAAEKLTKGQKQEGKKAKQVEKATEAKKKEAVVVEKVQIPEVSAERKQAILAEEERHRNERNSRSIFLSCQTFKEMKPDEIKALHPDVVSVRQMNRACWLMFPSEAATNKAYATLSKKKVLRGNELLVDFCDARRKNLPKNQPEKPAAEEGGGGKRKKKSYAEKQINPLELAIYNLPNTTTEDQLKIIFPAASKIRVVTKNSGNEAMSSKKPSAFVAFPNEAEAKKAFEKSGKPVLKIGGEPVDVFYVRV